MASTLSAELPIVSHPSQEIGLLKKYITEKASTVPSVKILEAGCGRSWPFNLNGLDCTLVGVDVDEHGLERRKNELGDLDETILGDLRTVDLPEEEFDVVYSSYVLEHVENAELALDNFVRWLITGWPDHLENP